MTATQVKVCGVTDPAIARTCAGSGVRWIGLNFHPGSPRHLDESRARAIVHALPSGVSAVGLFVDRPAAEVLGRAERVGLDYIQLHGSEPIEYLDRLAPWPVVRAFRIRDRAAVDAMAADLDRAERLGSPPFAILLDAHVPGQLGGTGHAIPTTLLDDLPAHPRIMLAGGLTPDNVADRVAQFNPWMVDVASGVESAPGRQDPARVAAFVAAVRGAGFAVRPAHRIP